MLRENGMSRRFIALGKLFNMIWNESSINVKLVKLLQTKYKPALLLLNLDVTITVNISKYSDLI